MEKISNSKTSQEIRPKKASKTTKAFKKKDVIYTDRGKLSRQGKVTWFSLLQRIRVNKHLKSKIRI
jgi:hypothetical protein